MKKKSYDEEVNKLEQLKRDNFHQNVWNGSFPYLSYLRGESLTTGETILARCAYCIHVAQDRTLYDCPDKECPLYRFMSETDPQDNSEENPKK
jgi:hypothetical protein